MDQLELMMGKHLLFFPTYSDVKDYGVRVDIEVFELDHDHYHCSAWFQLPNESVRTFGLDFTLPNEADKSLLDVVLEFVNGNIFREALHLYLSNNIGLN